MKGVAWVTWLLGRHEIEWLSLLLARAVSFARPYSRENLKKKKICFGKCHIINSWKQINCYFCEKIIKKNFMLHPVKLNVSYQEKSFFKFSFFLSFSVTWSKRGDNGMRKQDGGGGTKDCESGIFLYNFFLLLFSLSVLSSSSSSYSS